MPGYYEAKPQREMYFDDVQLAIIPEGTPSDITDFFDEYDVKYTTYKKSSDWKSANANISNAVKEYLADNPVADSYIRYMYADIDVDKFDGAYYTKRGIKVSKKVYNRLYSWGQTNHFDDIYKPFKIFDGISGYNYICLFDDEYNMTVLKKFKSRNIHETELKSNVDTNGKKTSNGYARTRNWDGYDYNGDILYGDTGTSNENGQVFGEKTQTSGQGNGRRYNEGNNNANLLTNEASSNEDAFSMPKNQYEGATSDNRSILANALKTDNIIINKLNRQRNRNLPIKWSGFIP